MGESVRRAARSAAVDAQVALRRERAERGRRLDGLAVEVAAALRERDAAAAAIERRAGAALSQMCDEGLTLRAAVDWCGDGLTLGEATRLRRLARDTTETSGREPAAGNGLSERSEQSVAGPGDGGGADD